MTSAGLGLGAGLPEGARGAEFWHQEQRTRGWRPLSENDRYEFQRAASAPYLIREHEQGDDLRIEKRPWRLRGARPLVIVFRSGHLTAAWDGPGWLSLRRTIREADRKLAACPALAADAVSRASRRAEWEVSPVVSQFVYVAAPGGMELCHWGARIHEDFDAERMTLLSRYAVGYFQKMIDSRRRFDRKRIRNYSLPLHFPLSILLEPTRHKSEQ